MFREVCTLVNVRLRASCSLASLQLYAFSKCFQIPFVLNSKENCPSPEHLGAAICLPMDRRQKEAGHPSELWPFHGVALASLLRGFCGRWEERAVVPTDYAPGHKCPGGTRDRVRANSSQEASLHTCAFNPVVFSPCYFKNQWSFRTQCALYWRFHRLQTLQTLLFKNICQMT